MAVQVNRLSQKKDATMHNIPETGIEGGTSVRKSRLHEDSGEVQLKQSSKKRKTGKTEKKLEASETFEQKLARSDPDFLKFLKGEKSDLLKFEDGDLSEESDQEQIVSGTEDMDDVHEVKKKKKKKVSDGATKSKNNNSSDDDDDDVEPNDEPKLPASKKTSVTLKMVENWNKRLKEKDSLPVMLDLLGAFKAALQQVDSNEENESKFRVVGGEVFNVVVQTCLQEVVPFLLRHLKLPESKDANKPVLPSSSPRWKQVRQDVKSYIGDVVLLMSSVGSVDVVRALLKHILHLVVFAVGFPKLAKTMLKKLIEVWSSSSDERNSLLAFCSIHRLLRQSPDSLFDVGFKVMYTAYVRNTKFTSPSTLATIQVMQRSLVEVGKLNVEVTYKYAFTFIRQLAIHLRSAITVKKKETTQIVYNWQFIHSLSLWTRLICELNSDEYIHSLIYPLTQIIIGTIKLVPTAQYYPLRFLCVRQLNKLSSMTSTFIPVVPFLTEVLNEIDFHRPVRGSAKQSYNFMCILKLSKSELNSKSFRDGVIDQAHELILENLHIHAHSVGFPELCVPVVIELRKFIKNCKVPSYTRPIKELLAKITETTTVIVDRRRTATLNLRDVSAVTSWETSSRSAGTPLGKFYAIWRKLRDQQLQADLSQTVQQSTKDKKTPAKKDAEDNSDFDEDELDLLAHSASDDSSSGTCSDEEENSEQEELSHDNNKNRKSGVTENTSKQVAKKISKTTDVEDDSSEDCDDIIENMSLSDSDDDNDSDAD